MYKYLSVFLLIFLFASCTKQEEPPMVEEETWGEEIPKHIQNVVDSLITSNVDIQSRSAFSINRWKGCMYFFNGCFEITAGSQDWLGSLKTPDAVLFNDTDAAGQDVSNILENAQGAYIITFNVDSPQNFGAYLTTNAQVSDFYQFNVDEVLDASGIFKFQTRWIVILLTF